jgi:colanic acid biosynthesis glycosyl transferase WcaI
LRLLVVSQYFWPEVFRVNDLVSELVTRGHEVTVLTAWPNYPHGRVFPEFKRHPKRFDSFAGARIMRVPIWPRGSTRVSLAFNFLSFVAAGIVFAPWRLRGRRFDAIFVFAVSPITAALPAILLRWIKKAPLLLWALDLWPDTLIAVRAVRSQRLVAWIGTLVAFIYRRSDRILVHSHACALNVEKYGGDIARTRIFPGWAEPIFRAGLRDIPAAGELAEYRDTFNILFAGNIGESQDFPAIIDAADALRHRLDIRWLVVGGGRAAEWVRAEIGRRGLQRNVIMLGQFPLERMPSFYSAAAALLVSLKSDPLFNSVIPAKVPSYLGAGLPILAMLEGEGARIIQEAGAGLVCSSGQGRQLADCALKLVEMSPQTRSEMGRRGRDYCARFFDRERMITALENWMMEVAREQA